MGRDAHDGYEEHSRPATTLKGRAVELFVESVKSCQLPIGEIANLGIRSGETVPSQRLQGQAAALARATGALLLRPSDTSFL